MTSSYTKLIHSHVVIVGRNVIVMLPTVKELSKDDDGKFVNRRKNVSRCFVFSKSATFMAAYSKFIEKTRRAFVF